MKSYPKLLFAVALNFIFSGFTFSQQITGGGSHSLVICSDSTGRSWGANYSGQLGNGTTNSTTTPVSVSTISGLVAVASGWEHALALRNDSTVWAWGENMYGQLGDSSNFDSDTPVKVKVIDSIISISSGHIHTHSLAAKSDGSAWAWGYNSNGKLGDNTTTNRNFPARVHGPGNVGFLSGIIAVAGGHDFSLALKNDGTAWGWGANSFGQLGDSSNTTTYTPRKVTILSGARSIAVGDWHCIALKNDSTAWTWGYGGSGRLGDNSNLSKNAPVMVHGPNDVGFLTGIIAIAAGETFCLALKYDGTVWSWGKNDLGQLGDNSTTDRWTPVQVAGPGGAGFLSGIISIGAGARHAMALRNDGTLFTWGDNGSGQLGDGSYFTSTTPVQVNGLCAMPTSAEENISSAGISVFPNPTTGIFYLSTGDEINPGSSFAIYNLCGQIVYRSEINKKEIEIDLSALAKGFYLFRVQNGGIIIIKYMVLQ
ncbi:MAG TPA: T9SS type A sorting domain-containing protein [Bacteroidia bacterium]|nr:T9SS type A sorting domain-containing protein [Bacteroidia bacterium]